MDDLISRQAAIDALMDEFKRVPTTAIRAKNRIDRLPSAQEKPFNLPEIYIAEGCDTIEGEDGNVGFGVYAPDETKIYVAGDVEGEIRARALFHEVCHWVQAMCGRPFDEDEANEFSDIVYDALPSAQPEQDVLAWLLAYHTKSFELHGRYFPHEVISWLVNDFSKEFIAERREE